jgi:hypothetical protein
MNSYSYTPSAKHTGIFVVMFGNGLVRNIPALNRYHVPPTLTVGVWREKKGIEGYLAGETCNRGRCRGIIEEGVSSYDGCTCFRHPPCSYCTEGRTYCPECDWQAENA